MSDITCFRDHNLPGRGFRVFVTGSDGLPQAYLGKMWRLQWETEWHVIPHGHSQPLSTKKGKSAAIAMLEKAVVDR